MGTWATASYAAKNSAPAAPAAAAASGTATQAADLGALGSSDQTLRQIVHVSIGGSAVRVSLSNEFGAAPLVIGAAGVAVSSGGGSVRADSMRPLLFGGKPGITIPNGATVLSDPVSLAVAPLSDLAISLFVPAQTITTLTRHGNAVQTNLRVAGNAVSQAELAGGMPFYSYDFLNNVQVMAPADAGAIVAFGDSITDGAYVTRDSNMRWPDELARRLQADKKGREFGVLNEGIGGNRVLHDNTGPNALARLGSDALDQPGVKYIIVMEAINDIGHAYDTVRPYDMVTAADLIQGYEQMIERAHERGIKVIGATLTPYVGAKYASPAGEQVRVAVNQWIRSSGKFDGVIDFEAATRDPNKPDTFLPALEHGDHLHPGDAGYKVMGDAVDLGLFTR